MYKWLTTYISLSGEDVGMTDTQRYDNGILWWLSQDDALPCEPFLDHNHLCAAQMDGNAKLCYVSCCAPRNSQQLGFWGMWKLSKKCSLCTRFIIDIAAFLWIHQYWLRYWLGVGVPGITWAKVDPCLLPCGFIKPQSGGHLNIKMSTYEYRDHTLKGKTVSRPSYL